VIKILKPWDVQPPAGVGINARNPLAAGIVNAFTFNGVVYDEKRKQQWTPVAATGSLSYQGTAAGFGLYTNNGTIATLDLNEDWSGPSTLIIKCLIKGIDIPWGGLYFKYGSTTYQHSLQRNSSNNTLQFARNNSGAVVVTGSSISGMLNAPTTLAITNSSGSAGANWAVYRNGSLVYGFTYTVAQATGAGNLVLAGEPSLSASFDSDVVWLSFIRYDREMSAREIAAIGNRPEQLFTPRRIMLPVATGSTNPTLLAASAHTIGATYATPRVTFSR
jgi:hypothetical protein